MLTRRPAWGVILSARAVGLPAREVAIQTLIYAIGSTLRHNAACIWNDICDREFDRRVGKWSTRLLILPGTRRSQLSTLREVQDQAVGVWCGVAHRCRAITGGAYRCMLLALDPRGF